VRHHSTLLLLVIALLVSGCGDKTHIDPTLVSDLEQAIVVTAKQMNIPPAELPSTRGIADQAGLLAMQCEPAEVQAIRSGTRNERELRREASDAEGWLRGHPKQFRPPTMMTFLAKQSELDATQKLLLYALARQAKRESGYDPATSGR